MKLSGRGYRQRAIELLICYTMFRSTIDSFSVGQTTSAALTTATSDRGILPANLSGARAWHEQRSSSLVLLSRKRAGLFFTILVSSIPMRGISAYKRKRPHESPGRRSLLSNSIISPPISASEFDLICRLDRCVSTTGFHFKRMGTAAAVSLTSMSVINFERI